jgi:predicted RNase H-like HicB family nuclease
VIVNTDDPVAESRFLLRTAAIRVRGGLSPELTLKALTLYPAQALHLDRDIGSLEKGKDADFVVLSGAPFSVYTRVLETYIDGKRVFRLADEKDRAYQMGGFAAKPLTVELVPDPEQGGYTACVPDIPAYGDGETKEEAIADLQEALRGYIETWGLDDALRRVF